MKVAQETKLKMAKVVAIEKIDNKIFQIRGKKVMLDRDLAGLYEVETKQLTRQVRRNIERFPKDFMFRLTSEEYHFLRCQIDTFKRGRHSKYLPYAFTEQGVSMLSSVINSERAIKVNIQIMRTFVSLRKIALTYTGLKQKIETIEKKYDAKFKVVFQVIKKLLEPNSVRRKRKIGFHS